MSQLNLQFITTLKNSLHNTHLYKQLEKQEIQLVFLYIELFFLKWLTLSRLCYKHF